MYEGIYVVQPCFRFLERIVSNKSPVLLVGASGTAKTVTIVPPLNPYSD